MSKKTNKQDKIFKSSFFWKLFSIPSICISLMAIYGMFLPDEPGEEPTTWIDFFEGMIIILILWFTISFVIALIFNEVKNNKPKIKKVKEVQYIIKPEEKIVVTPEKNKEEMPKKTKKKVNNKCLYTCESILDAYEYKKMTKYFPQIYWSYVIRGTILNLIITSIIAIFSKNLLTTLIFLVVYQIFLMILYKVRLEYFSEKEFNSIQKKGIVNTEIHTEFYDDYFIRQGKIETIKINYNEIDRCVESDTNFYLKFGKLNKIIIIQKNSCDLELISFIRKKFSNLENHLGDKSKFKGVKKYHNPEFIKKFMFILFIITICSFLGAIWTMNLIDKINPQQGFNFTKNTWVFWCWLPVPLLSIILGFKYKNAGFQCTKNIISGFIIGVTLLMYGSFCLFPTFEQDYSKLYKYKTIIDAKLPDNGELEIQDWGTYFDEDKTNYTIINAYYYKEDVSNLVNSIETSNNWILSKEIKSELKILIPSQFRSDKDAYYSIYNKTTGQYNTLPEASGNYEIYAMKYDKSDKQLEIHKFIYAYK